jgi:hypothetical protein
MMMSLQQSVEWKLAREAEVLGESAISSTTNPIWPYLGSNASRRCGKPETYCLSYDAAFKTYLLLFALSFFMISTQKQMDNA